MNFYRDRTYIVSMKIFNICTLFASFYFALFTSLSFADTKPAYMVSEITYLDKDKYISLYSVEAKKAFIEFDAVFIASTDDKIVVRGDSPGHRVVIAKFPSLDKANAFIASEKYKKLRELGSPFFISRSYIVEGN